MYISHNLLILKGRKILKTFSTTLAQENCLKLYHVSKILEAAIWYSTNSREVNVLVAWNRTYFFKAFLPNPILYSLFNMVNHYARARLKTVALNCKIELRPTTLLPCCFWDPLWFGVWRCIQILSLPELFIFPL